MNYEPNNTKLKKNNKRDVINFALETDLRCMRTKSYFISKCDEF